MSGILDLITSQLGSSGAGALSKQLGADENATSKAIAAALPMLVGGLARNANKSPEGAAALSSALDRDHDGSVLDNVMDLLGGSGGGGGGALGGLAQLAGGLLGQKAAPSRATNGDGILGHVLGQKRVAVEKGIAQSSGLDLGQVAKLLPVLAPMVMGALGKVKKQQNLDANGLASALNQEQARVEQTMPGMKPGGLSSFLDMDGDGDITDDIMKLGAGLFSK